MVFIRQQLLAPLAFRQESFVVLLSITPLLDGVLRRDIIAPFHTSGPPLLQFHLAIEQWGNLWAGYTEVLNWYFPLTTSQVYAVCLTKHTKNISSGHNWEPARIEEWNNSYARIHPDGDLGYSVIAICKAQQQWGYSGYAVNFPISFGIVYNVLSIPQNTASTSNSYWGRFYITNLTKNGFTVSDTGAGSNRWLAIGKAQPQWRNNPGLWAIPFTEFVAGGITMTRTGSQSSGTWYGDSGTISLTGYTASCATNESWVSNISGSAIAVGL